MSSESPSHIRRERRKRNSGTVSNSQLKIWRDTPIDDYDLPMKETDKCDDEREYVHSQHTMPSENVGPDGEWSDSSDESSCTSGGWCESVADDECLNEVMDLLNSFPDFSGDPVVALRRYEEWLKTQPVERLRQYNLWLEKQPGWIRHQNLIHEINERFTDPHMSEVCGPIEDLPLIGGGRGRGGRRGMKRGRQKNSGRRLGGSGIARGAFGVADRINNVKLTYRTNDTLNNATALNPFTSSYFIPTWLLNLNNALATNEPFFNAYAAMYRKYRLRKVMVKATFTNAEAFGGTGYISIWGSDPTLGAGIPLNLLNNQISSQNCVKRAFSGKGGMDRAVVMKSYPIRKAGFATTNVEDSFVALTATGSLRPSDNSYVVVGVDNNGAASVSGCLVDVEFILFVDFMERQTPVS